MTGFDSKRQASKSLAANPWMEAIDAELVCLHLGTADSFPTAQAALYALIDWHVATALDPEVSSDAQALIDRGAAAVAEPLTEEQEKYAELLYAVGSKWPGETRHQTALRYILQAEQACQPEPAYPAGTTGMLGESVWNRAVEAAHGIKGSAALEATK